MKHEELHIMMEALKAAGFPPATCLVCGLSCFVIYKEKPVKMKYTLCSAACRAKYREPSLGVQQTLDAIDFLDRSKAPTTVCCWCGTPVYVFGVGGTPLEIAFAVCKSCVEWMRSPFRLDSEELDDD